MFTHVPPGKPGKPPAFPLITRESLPEVRAALDRTGVVVSNIEFFPILGSVPAETYREAFALGQELGAARAVVHIHEPDDAVALARLQEVADLAAEHGLALGLEFMGLTPHCNSLERAVRFVTEARRSNIGIAVDALHLVRTGGQPSVLLALPAELFAYAQVCDGRGLHLSANYMPEAMDREMPGDGDFPLLALLNALPGALPLDVEVPSPRRAAQGIAAADRVREAVARTRALLAGAVPLR